MVRIKPWLRWFGKRPYFSGYLYIWMVLYEVLKNISLKSESSIMVGESWPQPENTHDHLDCCVTVPHKCDLRGSQLIAAFLWEATRSLRCSTALTYSARVSCDTLSAIILPSLFFVSLSMLHVWIILYILHLYVYSEQFQCHLVHTMARWRQDSREHIGP